jgi:CheY-like chemotaxis protein
MPRILFVDDNQEFIGVVSPILNQVGYDVVTANNGAEAIDSFRKLSFDAVVTDLMMPDISGYELVKHIRETSNGSMPIIIAITGTSWEVDTTHFDLVLEKPFSIKKLISCLKDFENMRAIS